MTSQAKLAAFQESVLGEYRSILVQVPNELSSEAINLYTKEIEGIKCRALFISAFATICNICILSVSPLTYASAATALDYCKRFMKEAFGVCNTILPLYEDS